MYKGMQKVIALMHLQCADGKGNGKLTRNTAAAAAVPYRSARQHSMSAGHVKVPW